MLMPNAGDNSATGKRRQNRFRDLAVIQWNQNATASVIRDIRYGGEKVKQMKQCRKCHGSMRFDREFPGMVCQMCGIVRYFDPYPEIIKVARNPRAGMDRAKAARAA